MERRQLLQGFAVALAFPGLARADEVQSFKLSKAFAYLDKFLGLPAAMRTRFNVVYYAMRDRKPAPDLQGVIVEADGRRTPLQLDHDGRVVSMPTLGLLRSDAKLEAAAAPGVKLGLRLELHPNVALSPHPDPAALAQSLAQANAAIATLAGAMSFAAPKLTAAIFVQAGSGQAILANGKIAPLPLGAGRFAAGQPYFEPAATPGAKALTLARTPARISLSPHPAAS
ncbi:MAG: hypothetical protein ACHP84_01850 [Caulobacterales bacterium]